ncbi:MAG: hypothetical protein DWQ08_00900 [Proteobacteria bacterium]|nr:MAG: hypothetical protein DWQ08_00900 [Pseudomonadota bacterium]
MTDIRQELAGSKRSAFVYHRRSGSPVNTVVVRHALPSGAFSTSNFALFRSREGVLQPFALTAAFAMFVYAILA